MRMVERFGPRRGGLAAGDDQIARLVDGRHERHPLFGAGVEPGGDVPARDDQGVPAVHREGVPERDQQRVFEDDVLGGRLAEGAGGDGGRRHQGYQSYRA